MNNTPLNRRAFARRMALSAAAIAPLSGCAAPLPADEADQKSPNIDKPAGQREDQPTAEPKPLPPEALILALVEHDYPSQLSDEQQMLILREIASHRARSKRLSQFPLTNADEPAFSFQAYRA